MVWKLSRSVIREPIPWGLPTLSTRVRVTKTDDIAGVSHFLEHMVFKGTPQRTADDVNRELDEIGSHSNAYTSEERTVYYSNLLPELQERAVDFIERFDATLVARKRLQHRETGDH